MKVVDQKRVIVESLVDKKNNSEDKRTNNRVRENFGINRVKQKTAIKVIGIIKVFDQKLKEVN